MSRHTQRFTIRKAPTCGGPFNPRTSQKWLRSTGGRARPHIHGAGPPLGADATVHQVSSVKVFLLGRCRQHLVHWRTWLPPTPALLAPRSFPYISLGFPRFSDRPELNSHPQGAGAASLAPDPSSDAFGICRGGGVP